MTRVQRRTLRIFQVTVELDIVYLGLETRLNKEREHQVSGYITVSTIAPRPSPAIVISQLPSDPSELLLGLSVTLSLTKGLGEAFIVLGLVENSFSCSTLRSCGPSFGLELANNSFSSTAAVAL